MLMLQRTHWFVFAYICLLDQAFISYSFFSDLFHSDRHIQLLQMNLLLIFNISVWGQKHLWQVGIDPCQHVLLNGLGAGPERGHCSLFIHKLTHVRINSTMKMLFSSIRHLVRHLNTPSLKHSAHKRKNICLSFGTFVCARWKIFHFNWNICTCWLWTSRD